MSVMASRSAHCQCRAWMKSICFSPSSEEASTPAVARRQSWGSAAASSVGSYTLACAPGGGVAWVVVVSLAVVALLVWAQAARLVAGAAEPVRAQARVSGVARGLGLRRIGPWCAARQQQQDQRSAAHLAHLLSSAQVLV